MRGGARIGPRCVWEGRPGGYLSDGVEQRDVGPAAVESGAEVRFHVSVVGDSDALGGVQLLDDE